MADADKRVKSIVGVGSLSMIVLLRLSIINWMFYIDHLFGEDRIPEHTFVRVGLTNPTLHSVTINSRCLVNYGKMISYTKSE